MTDPTPGRPGQDEPAENVRIHHVDATQDLDAIALSYGRPYALGVVHSCALLALNAIAHDMLQHARAVGRLTEADVKEMKAAMAQASADASSVAFEALCQERSAVDILQTAQELRQRTIDRMQTPPGFKPV